MREAVRKGRNEVRGEGENNRKERVREAGK